MRVGDHAGGNARRVGRAQVAEGVTGEHLPQPLDEVAAARPVRLGQDAREFVAAIARDEIGGAQLALQDGADLAQHTIARGVAQPVVDLAQMIDVDQDERKVQ